MKADECNMKVNLKVTPVITWEPVGTTEARVKKEILDEMFWLYESASEPTMFDFWTELGYYDENGDYVDRQEG